MSECISAKELSQNSPNDSNQEKNFQNDIDPEFTKEHTKQPGTNIDFVSQSEDNPSQLQDPDDDGEGCRSVMSEEGLNEDGAILLSGIDESTASKDGANFDLIGSTERGEVSEEEFHGAAASPEKRFDPLVPESAVDQENQEEFFEDDRSETPLQDEQENELCDKSSDKNDGDLDYAMAGVRITNAALMPLQTEQNTDGELSEEGTSQGLVDECDIENEGELERPSYGFAKETEKKHAVTDDYGELDYEEEEADDCLDKGKPGEDKKRRDRLGSKDVSTTKQEEGSNEPAEDGKEVVGSKESTAEKKETESGEEEGEEPEEGEEKQEGEEPEEGEKSTDGELDDDDDCEEGEIREPGQKHVFIRPMCRFYTRGNCTWGNNCRFLHPGINDKGNYSMIDQSFPPGPPAMMGPVMGPCIRGPLPPPPGPPGPWIHERLGKRIIPHRPMEAEPEVPLASAPLPAPPTVGEAAASESAWERGLRHAKEIRKNAKRKETDPAFDDKKDADVEDERPPAPAPPVIPPPPPIANPLPPPRDPYYDDLPSNRYEDEGFYARPPVPLPPPDAWPFRPPPMDPFEMRWMRPLEFPPPPHPDFRLSERERAMRDRRFSPPPRFGRFEPRFFRDGPAREPLPAPPTDTLVRGRGEEWKDPWLRSRSPKRKRNSSSRSGSRGRRRSRSRSRSYSSFSSSSGSSKSRSRSRSSSYSSSYSKSSHSRSSFSSRSSSHSRSRSGSAKKRLPLATTLGQSIMEKHGKTGDGPRSVINKVPQSAIGSVPLPPGDKGSVPSVSQAAKAIPMPSQPSVTASVRPPDPTPVETVKPPPQTPPTVTKPTTSSVVMPIGAKPIVVPGRPAPLQPVGRVASVFLEKDDEPYEVPNSNRPPLPLPTSLASPDKLLPPPTGDKSKAHAPERAVDKTPGVATVERPGHGRSQPPVEPNRGRSKEVAPGPAPKGSSDSRQAASSEKPLGRAPQSRSSGKELAKSTAPGAPADRMPSRNQLPGGDRQPARMPPNSEKITVKIVPLDREVPVRGSSSQPAAKAALRPGESYMGRGGPPATKTDSATKHRTKRASSTDSSRSTSGSRSRSSSSVSHDSEHLYSDIASPISSASSHSPIRSPAVKPRLVQVDKARIPPIKNSSGRLPAPPQASSAQYGMQRSSDGYRGGGGGDQKGDRVPLSSSRPPQQSISSHMPSSRGAGRDIREGGGRDVGSREVSGRTVGSMGGVSHSRDAGMMESRMRSSSSSGHALQGNFPSSRNLDMHPSQKISSEKSSSHLPMPHSASNRKRPASPIGRFSPPSKTIRRAPEHKEPVKIPIPRHEKLTKLSSPPQRRRSDSNQAPLVSPLGKGPTTIPTKHPPPSAKPPSSASTSGGNASKRKGAMSRREELLMQLQAVEDAIAKKRSKMQ